MISEIKLYNSLSCILVVALFSTAPAVTAQPGKLNKEVRQTMLKATEYMVEQVSANGGYVDSYLPDFSRSWGELEAYSTQIWVQGATPNMGNIFLDAYESTGNEYYYHAAEQVAHALIWGQLPSGGWHYIIDFAGDRSLKRWHQTIGENAWGFEEYYHYYGNATLDDDATAGAARFLLRIYLQKMDPAYRLALDKAIEFFIESQYPLGGWPQRYPLMYEYSKGGKNDYTSFYTFNDNVTEGAIDYLIRCYVALGQERLLDPIRRGMNFYLLAQQGNPQGGWGLQHNMELEPAHARSYEPASLSPGTTVRHIRLLMQFYRYTGDRRFLARIPDAIDWLERARLDEERTEGGRYTHPTFVEVGTDKPLFAHRRGTGVNEGEYWVDYDDQPPLRHYGSKTRINVESLRSEYQKVEALTPEEATEGSPLNVERYQGEQTPQEDYYQMYEQGSGETPDESEIREVINSLDETGRWLVQHLQISRPYSVNEAGQETNTAKLSDEEGAGIRDTSDQQYISTREYTRNMELLMDYLNQFRGGYNVR